MKTAATLLFLAGVSVLTGCSDKSPYDRTKSTAGGGTGTYGASPAFIIFANELASGGGAFEYPGSEGQTLIFTDTSNPVSNRSIRYGWTGERVAGQFLFAGFTLMHTPEQAEYSGTPGRDLTDAGYSRVRFFARGALSSNTLAKIEVADDGTPGVNGSCVSLSMDGTLDDNVNAGGIACGRTDTLTSSWQEFIIPIVSPNTAMANVKDFFKVTYVFNNVNVANTLPGEGGTIYIDQIQYE